MDHLLIVGGAGSYGQHRVARLLRAGHRVTVLDASTQAPAWEALQRLQEEGLPLHLAHGDLLDDDWISLLRDSWEAARRDGALLSVENLTLLHHGHNLLSFDVEVCQYLHLASVWFVEGLLTLKAPPETLKAHLFLDYRWPEAATRSATVEALLPLFRLSFPLGIVGSRHHFLGAVSSTSPWVSSVETLPDEGEAYTVLSPQGDFSFSVPGLPPRRLLTLLREDPPTAYRLLRPTPDTPIVSPIVSATVEPATLYTSLAPQSEPTPSLS